MRRSADARVRSKRLAITGLGVISSLGVGANTVWQAARRGQTHMVRQTFGVVGKNQKAFFFHKVRTDHARQLRLNGDIRGAVDSWKDGRIDEDLVWAIEAARMAIRDSRLRYNHNDNAIGLFVSHENPGLESFFDRTLRTSYSLLGGARRQTGRDGQTAFRNVMYQQCVADGYDAQTFVYLHLIGKALGIHGFTSFNCNACASGLYSLEMAAREIRVGGSPVTIVVASDHPRYLYKFLWFDDQELYAPDGLIKPFDRRRNGFSIGDGAAALVLEEWTHAKARGAKIYAEYLGGGFGAQGWKMTVPDLTSSVYRRAMEQALAAAGLRPGDIDLVVPHGVGTGVGDAYEARAINWVFGPANRQPPISALKPYMGHNLGGSALLETVLTLLCMRHDTILPTLNYEVPDETLGVNIVTQPVTRRLRYVMKCASGFGGYDASIVLGRA